MRAERFHATVNSCDLVDLEFVGGKFTWQWRCRGGLLISRRLDRGLGDLTWGLAFPEATMEHTLRRHSDHVPILLRCGAVDRTRTDRPFLFQIAWCAHEAYHKVVHDAWSVQGVIFVKLSNRFNRGPLDLTRRSLGTFLPIKGRWRRV